MLKDAPATFTLWRCIDREICARSAELWWAKLSEVCQKVVRADFSFPTTNLPERK